MCWYQTHHSGNRLNVFETQQQQNDTDKNGRKRINKLLLLQLYLFMHATKYYKLIRDTYPCHRFDATKLKQWTFQNIWFNRMPLNSSSCSQVTYDDSNFSFFFSLCCRDITHREIHTTIIINQCD